MAFEILCRMAHFPNPAAAGPISADEVVTIYANWTPFFRTIITDDELYCSQQEEPRVRSQHLPRDDRRRQKDFSCPDKANDLHSRGCGGCCLLCSERSSQAHRRVQNWQGSHDRTIVRVYCLGGTI